MKIAFVTPYYTPSVGGVQQYVDDLVQAYKTTHEVVVITTRLDDSQTAHEVRDGVTIYRLPVLMKIANTPFHPYWKRQLRKIFRAEAPDVINAHAPVPWFADVAQRANKNRVPFVLTYHSGSMKKGSFAVDMVIGFYERYVLPKTLRRATQLIGVYPDFLRTLIGSTRHIAHITPGIDTEFFAPKKTKKRYDVIFAGRLEQTSSWKGLDIALEAIAALRTQHPTISFAIAGDGNARTFYQNQAEHLGIADNVTFLGGLDRQKLRDVYRASSVIVLPSKTESESFGMVVAEAASCAVPAVGSNIGGIPHVIEAGKTGLIVPPGDSSKLADALHQLLSNTKQLRTYGAAARQRVLKYFSKQAFIESTSATIQQAISASQPKNLQVVAFYPPALGGMENVVEQIARHLALAGQHVEVVASNIGYEPGYQDFKHPNYEVTRLSGKNIFNQPVIPGLLWHLLRQPKGTIFHMHVAQSFLPEITWLAARLRRGRFVAHFHLDVVASGRFGWLFSLYKRTLFPLMLRHADTVIVFSEGQRQLVQRRYGVASEKIFILPNGVDEVYFHDQPRKLSPTPELLFVGRLSSQKHPETLLEALPLTTSDVHLTIVGSGDKEAELKNYAAKHELHNVTFAGRQGGTALLNTYRNADIFVLPSEREGMPLVVLEAMAMRLVVVATNVIGTRDLVAHEHTGLLVPFNDPKAMAETIDQLAKDAKTYQQLSQNAYDFVRPYAWPHLVARLQKEVY